MPRRTELGRARVVSLEPIGDSVPERCVDLAPDARSLLLILADGGVPVSRLVPSLCPFVQILEARGLIETYRAAGGDPCVRLTYDGSDLHERGLL